jgi:tRNA threonylcarbamoyladenosine biosynthesis protein TsaE
MPATKYIRNMDIEVYNSTSEEATNKLGAVFSTRLKPGVLVAFFGELGAGKTEFIKGICEGMEVEEIVASPTYTIVNQYSGIDSSGKAIRLYHIDLYRIESADELTEIGLDEIVSDLTAIKLIEWAEHAEMMLPAERYDIHFHAVDDNSRRIEIVHRVTVAAAGAGGMRLFL